MHPDCVCNAGGESGRTGRSSICKVDDTAHRALRALAFHQNYETLEPKKCEICKGYGQLKRKSDGKLVDCPNHCFYPNQWPDM